MAATVYSATGKALAVAAVLTVIPRSQTSWVMWCLTEPHGVDDRAQPRHGAQGDRTERRAAPAGEQHLGLVESGALGGIVGAEVGDEEAGVEVGDAGEPVQGFGGQDRRTGLAAHRQDGAGSGPPVRGGVAHLTAPAVRPERQKRWRQRKAMIRGTTATREPMMTSG